MDEDPEIPKYLYRGEEKIKNKKSLLHELQHLIQEKEGFARGGSFKDPNYRNLAGEVEARTVARRTILNNEEKAKIAPFEPNSTFGYDVAPKNQIVRFGDTGNSAEFNPNSKLYDELTNPRQTLIYREVFNR